MPMYRDKVPEKIRPWIYIVFLVFFQLTGCIYLGAASHVVGSTGTMTEDVMFIGLCNVIGVNMPFPLLFRFKFRFTNRQLLINAALVIAICNFLAMHTTSVPVLAALSFLAGFFKLCGTFECASNIQLWMAPGRDFQIFFPLLYIVVVGDIYLQGWMTGVLTYFFQGGGTEHGGAPFPRAHEKFLRLPHPPRDAYDVFRHYCLGCGSSTLHHGACGK